MSTSSQTAAPTPLGRTKLVVAGLFFLACAVGGRYLPGLVGALEIFGSALMASAALFGALTMTSAQVRLKSPGAAVISIGFFIALIAVVMNIPVQSGEVDASTSSHEPIDIPAPAPSRANSDYAALQARCISQAKAQGYKTGQCAYTFIQTCVRTQSRAEMESVLRADAMLGIGPAQSCPNMPTTYVEEFDRF